MQVTWNMHSRPHGTSLDFLIGPCFTGRRMTLEIVPLREPPEVTLWGASQIPRKGNAPVVVLRIVCRIRL
jgi:hypothetical protein